MVDKPTGKAIIVPRDAAVALHGSHWMVRLSDPPAIREELGRERTGRGSADEAERVAKEARVRRAKREIEEAERALGRPRNRAAILLARMGLHRRSKAILEAVAKHRATIARRQVELADTGWRPERVGLAETFRMPRILPVGTPVWEVGREWPVEHGIRLRELKVAQVAVHSLRATEGFDYSVVHHLERVTHGPGTPASTPSFGEAPDGDTFPPAESVIQSSRLFLSREAACRFLEETAQLLERRAAEARSMAAGRDPSSMAGIRVTVPAHDPGEAAMAERAKVYIKVEGEPSHDDDDAVAGAYLVEVDADLSEGDRASAALDAFHESIGIKVLEDFEVTTWDAEGKEIAQGEAEGYTMGEHAEYLGMIDPEDFPEAKPPGTAP